MNIECSPSFRGYCRSCLCLVRGRGAAGWCPAWALAAIRLLSQSLDRAKHAEHLGCDEAVIPCLQLLAGKALRHARPGLGAFPRQGHRGRAGLSRGARCLPCPALPCLGPGCWAGGCPPEDCRPSSHLPVPSWGSQGRQPVCCLSSAW